MSNARAWGHAVERAPLPETLAELEEMRLDIIEEMSAIRNQLTQRKAEIDQLTVGATKANAYGTPQIDRKVWADYQTWRSRATAALRHFEMELLEVKAVLAEKRSARGVVGLGPPPTVTEESSALDLLAALYRTSRRLAAIVGKASSDGRIDPTDQAVIEVVQGALQRKL